jgi:hypothetical protein
MPDGARLLVASLILPACGSSVEDAENDRWMAEQGRS